MPPTFYASLIHDRGARAMQKLDDMNLASHCRSLNHSAQQSDVYKVFFSFRNISSLLDRVESMGFPRPADNSEGLYRNMYRIYQIYPGYQGIGADYWNRGTLMRHVQFMNDQFMRLYVPEIYAKQALYSAYDKSRSSPLQPPLTPYLDYCTGRRAPVYTGRLPR